VPELVRTVTARINISMRVDELLETEQDLEDWQASSSLCKSSKPNSAIGASALASCKSQGLRSRSGKKSHKLGPKPSSRTTMGGKKIKGKAYGGPLPDYGSGTTKKGS
jgi:hypothetical protein